MSNTGTGQTFNLSGTGNLFIYTRTGAETIDVGFTGTGTMQISDAEWQAIQNAVSITVGKSLAPNQQSGNISIQTAQANGTSGGAAQSFNTTGSIELDDDTGGTPSVALATGGAGAINLNAGATGILVTQTTSATVAELATTGKITIATAGPVGTAANRLQFVANQDDVEISAGGAVYLDGINNLTLGALTYGAVTTSDDLVSITTQLGDLVLSGPISTGAGNITLSPAGTVYLNYPTGTGNIITQTTANLNVTRPVILQENATIVQTTGNAINTLTFTTVNDEAANTNTLTITGNASAVTVNGPIGASFPLNGLTITGGTINIANIGNSGTLAAGAVSVSVTAATTGGVNLLGSWYRTTGAQTWQAGTVATPRAITTSAATTIFSNTNVNVYGNVDSSAAGYNLTIRADDIDLNPLGATFGTWNLGTNTLNLYTATASTVMNVGFDSGNALDWNLDDSEIASLTAGAAIGALVIGESTVQSGAITFRTADFSGANGGGGVPITANSDAATGYITLDNAGAAPAIANADSTVNLHSYLRIEAAQTSGFGHIASAGQITLTTDASNGTRIGAGTLPSTPTLPIEINVSPTTRVDVTGRAPQGVWLTGVGGAIYLGTVSVTGPIITDIYGGGGTIYLTHDIDTNGDNIVYNQAVRLRPTVGTSISIQTGNGSITFASTLDEDDAGGVIAGTNSLSIDAGNGTVLFSGNVGGDPAGARLTEKAFQNLTITDAGNVTFQAGLSTANGGSVNVTHSGILTINDATSPTDTAFADLVLDGSFTESGTGSVQIAGDIATSNDTVNFNTAVELTGNVRVYAGATGNDITFADAATVSDATAPGPYNLLLNAGGSGDVTFGATNADASARIGGAAGAGRIGALSIENANAVTFNGQVYAASIAQTASNATTGSTVFNRLVNTNTAAGIDLNGRDFAFYLPVTATGGGIMRISNTGTLLLPDTADCALDGAFTQDVTTGPVLLGAEITTTSDQIAFAGPITLTNAVTLDTTGGSTAGADISFLNTATVNETADGAYDLNLNAGTNGDITFGTAIGDGNARIGGNAGAHMPSALRILNGNAVTLNGQVYVTDFAQSAANATTGLTVFNRTVNTGGLSFSGRRLTFNGAVSSAGAVSITNSGLFLTAEDADITLTAGNFTQNGAGLNQMAGGVVTNGGAIAFATDVYLYGSTGTMAFGRNGADNVISFNGDLHIAANGKAITFASGVNVAGSAALYNGTVSFAATATIPSLATGGDIVLLNGNPATMYADAATGVGNLYAYINAQRTAAIVNPPSLAALAAAYPDASAFPATYTGALGDLAGTTLAPEGNFYDNGVDLAGTGAWTLSIPDNADATDSFAEAYNATIDNCTVTVNLAASPTGAFAWLAAAEGCADGGGNSGVDFARPTIVQAGTYTVYDNVIRVEASEAIENTNNEISAALANIRYWDGSALASFTGSFVDRDCNTSTDGAGDLTVFYLQTSADWWNTDATGISMGDAQSTDRGRGATEASHRSAIPYVNLPKALGGLYQTLRDSHKNRIGHYYSATPSVAASNAAAGATFTAVADRCAPVLVAVFTGQETHDFADDNAAQRPYDSHNFIEFQWSEQVTIPSVADSDVNVRATAGEGAITVSGSGLDIAGFAAIASGSLNAGERAYGTNAGAASSDVHALYRFFSRNGTGSYAAQTHRIRVSIAGFAQDAAGLGATEYRWYWPGYIAGAVTPTGAVTDSSTSLAIADTSAAANGIESFGSATYPRAAVTVSVADPTNPLADSFYGDWDTVGPAPAALRMAADAWSDPIAAYEAVPDSSGGIIDRLEMHFFDNAVAYTAADTHAWYSRNGWYPSADVSRPIYGQASAAAPESFGGARPLNATGTVSTRGGIRESSLNAAVGAFRVFNNNVALSIPPDTFSTNVTTNLLAPVANQNVAGDPYFRLFWTGLGGSGTQLAGSSITVSYNADSPAVTGYVTDLAGNLLGPFSKIVCVDRTPPRMTFSLAGADRNDLYVLFSKRLAITDPADVAAGLTVTLSGTPVTLTGTPTVSAGNRALLYRLDQAVEAADLVSPASGIAVAGTGTIITDPDTGSFETSYFIDELGNYAVVGDTHRLTDIGIGLAGILYGSDGVNQPGLLGGSSGALRSGDFDGSGRLLDKDITVATRINLPTAPGALSLFYDVNPAVETMPKTFNDATGLSFRLWLPSVLSGFNQSGNQEARNLSPILITDAGTTRLLRNFLIPESDPEVRPGATVELLMQYEGLFCARLSDESDITSIAPWSFSISETKKQRGGVTILNNVIDSGKREKTIVQVELPKAGNLVIQVFTLDGNVVRVLERGLKGGGTYSYFWDGTNAAGNPVARGIYFIRVVGPGMDEIRKVMVVKE